MFPRASLCAVLLLTPLAACSADDGTGAGTGKSGSHVAWHDGGLDDALAQARSESKLVFVDFWAEWCGPCKRLEKTTFADASVITELNQVIAVSVDTDSSAGKPVAQRYRVRFLPTLVVLRADGTEVARQTGYMDPRQFREWLATARK